MKYFLALSILAGVFSWARFLTPTFDQDHGGLHLEQSGQSVHLHKRDTRSLCAPATYSSQQRRDSGEWIDGPRSDVEFNGTDVGLVRRTMTLPGDSMDLFMTDEMKKPDVLSIIWQKKVDGQWQDMATSLFDQFKDEAFSYGTGFLCGCTTLVLISRRGVYIAHYWENVSFDPDREWLDRFGNPDAAFKRTVIKGLSEGVGRGSRTEQVSLKGAVRDLDDDYLKGYLMIPSQGASDQADPYRARWNSIKATVAEFIPKMSDESRWTEVKYEATSDQDILGQTARGRLLFKYDPDHNGKKKATLWIEYQKSPPAHDDEW